MAVQPDRVYSRSALRPESEPSAGLAPQAHVVDELQNAHIESFSLRSPSQTDS